MSQLRNRYPGLGGGARRSPAERASDATTLDTEQPRRARRCADAPRAGAALRAAREAAGLSIDDVAQQLKLAPRQVQALEDDDYARLPGRTFVRGFVRNYARFVRLDPDDGASRCCRRADDRAVARAPDVSPSRAAPMGELPVERAAKPSCGALGDPAAARGDRRRRRRLRVCARAAGATRAGTAPRPRARAAGGARIAQAARDAALPNPLGTTPRTTTAALPNPAIERAAGATAPGQHGAAPAQRRRERRPPAPLRPPADDRRGGRAAATRRCSC